VLLMFPDLTDQNDKPGVDAPPAQAFTRPEWDMRLVVDVALGASEESILETYDLQAHQYARICQDPTFQARLHTVRKDLEQNGASFRLKAQLMAEALLPTAYELVTDRESGATVRGNMLQNIVRWAGYSNDRAGAVQGAGGGFSINITFNGAPTDGTTIEGQVDG